MKRRARILRRRGLWVWIWIWVWVWIVTVAPLPTRGEAPPPGIAGLRFGPEDAPSLRGPDARRQIIVTGALPSGALRDLTRDVTYEAGPPGIVEVDAGGFVRPLADGEVEVTAHYSGAAATAGAPPLRASTTLRVQRFDSPPPVHFGNQIVPIFTKKGCNGGGCHGKSGGQNGFRLSLLGFYPHDDHEYLTRESRGRRVFAAIPDQSLLLLKATNLVPHGGGRRIEPDSTEYRLIRRWLLQGMPPGAADAASVERIEVFPPERVLGKGAAQQLAVLAHYTDGSSEDVTRLAQFESNNAEMAAVSETGLVHVLGVPGEVAVMVRFQARVDVFRATVPHGVDVREADLPLRRNFIDELVFARHRRLGIPPSRVCDGATFLRRVTLDLAGRLPTVEEATGFEADTTTGKRRAAVERLLASTGYADYFANKWSSILRNRRDNERYARGTFAFHRWIRAALHRNMPYDEFVRAIVAASGGTDRHPPVVWYRSVSSTHEQVEDTAQLFLGVRIQCARCHHHPFEKWSEEDYYGLTAFFSRVGRKDGVHGLRRNEEPRIYHRRGTAAAENPRTGVSQRPTELGGAPLDLPAGDDPRLALAAWMAEPDNPFFARALVNRYWKHFFDRGLVEPEDDMRVTNPPTNPELLDALSEHFIAGGFDLKELVRTICDSTTYQLESLPNEHNERDTQNYSRFYPRRLHAEVLYDAVHGLLGAPARFDGLLDGTRAVQLPDSGVNNYFLTVFGRPMAQSACECERSQDANLAQSLHLLNSSDIHEKLTAETGRAARLARETERSVEERVRELYYRAFARAPATEELAVATAYVGEHAGGARGFEDIIWALINTKEFLFNH